MRNAIENIPITKKSKASNLDINELKELCNKLIELKSQSNDDCGCSSNSKTWYPPILCQTLTCILIAFVLLILWFSYIGWDIPIRQMGE